MTPAEFVTLLKDPEVQATLREVLSTPRVAKTKAARAVRPAPVADVPDELTQARARRALRKMGLHTAAG